jgi:hypothetical protein
VKNIKYPIQTYEVKGQKEDLHQTIEEKHDGFSLFIDPKKITDISRKKDLLEEALYLLNHWD